MADAVDSKPSDLFREGSSPSTRIFYNLFRIFFVVNFKFLSFFNRNVAFFECNLL